MLVKLNREIYVLKMHAVDVLHISIFLILLLKDTLIHKENAQSWARGKNIQELFVGEKSSIFYCVH